MSDSDFVRVSTDFDGWDPDSIFCFDDTAIKKHSTVTPAKKVIRTANLNSSRENCRDNTNVIESRSRGIAGTFPETSSKAGSPNIFDKIMGSNEIISDQNEKRTSEDDRLKMMKEEKLLLEHDMRLEKETLSIKAAITFRKKENHLLEQRNELDLIRNKKGRQHNEDVKMEKSRPMKEATDDLLEDSMDNQRNKEVQEELWRREEEMHLQRLETERLEKIDVMRKEKERIRRNQEIEEEKERIAFLEAEKEARELSCSSQGDEEEDVGDDDSLTGNMESSARNTVNNVPKSVFTSIPHTPRNVVIDFGDSVDLDDSLDARGQYSMEENSRHTANSGDNTTANTGESSSALLSFGKNNDFNGNGRDQSTGPGPGPGPHLSSSISASIWERGSAARTLQSVYRGVLGR